jgi:hypothetical protein
MMLSAQHHRIPRTVRKLRGIEINGHRYDHLSDLTAADASTLIDHLLEVSS